MCGGVVADVVWCVDFKRVCVELGGQPYGTVARVNIGQVIFSIRCKDANAPVIQEALRRARYKFPGRQKIIVSKKWGFTNVNKEDYLKLKAEKRVIQCVIFIIFFGV